MQKEESHRFLVFSAHPDDLDFACSGTVAKLTAEGHQVCYCIITNGEKGMHKVKQTKEAMIAMREKEQRAAASAVGVENVTFLGLTDGELENTPEVRRQVARMVRKCKPHVVIAPDPGNQRFDHFGRFHRDHRVTAEIVFDAIYPAVGSDAFFPELLEEEVLPHQIDGVWFYNPSEPDHVVDITKTIEKKLDALRAHESQIKDMDAVGEYIRKNASIAAEGRPFQYAEAFRRLSF